MANILIAGANGLIGKEVSAFLHKQGHSIRWLVRHKSAEVAYPQFIWDPQHHQIDLDAFKSVEVIVNFSGSPIGSGRWTARRKREILDSRLQSIRLLSEAMTRSGIRVHQIIQASAIGYYGDRSDTAITEADAAGSHGFLCEVAKKWEAEAALFQPQTQILTIVRTGLYLSSHGGVWPKLIMTLPFRFISYFGDGNQIFSWIHSSDYVRAIDHLIENKISGPVNFTAPHPVSHKDLVLSIRKNYKCQLIPGPPKWFLKILLGEMSSLLLDSCHALPKVLQDSGFQFNHPRIDTAVQSLLRNSENK